MDALCVQGAPKRRECLHSGLSYKRQSSGRFPFWPDGATPTRALEACELQLLLMGGDPTRTHAAPAWRPLSLAA